VNERHISAAADGAVFAIGIVILCVKLGVALGVGIACMAYYVKGWRE
jgi:hypothetical protein